MTRLIWTVLPESLPVEQRNLPLKEKMLRSGLLPFPSLDVNDLHFLKATDPEGRWGLEEQVVVLMTVGVGRATTVCHTMVPRVGAGGTPGPRVSLGVAPIGVIRRQGCLFVMIFTQRCSKVPYVPAGLWQRGTAFGNWLNDWESSSPHPSIVFVKEEGRGSFQGLGQRRSGES